MAPKAQRPEAAPAAEPPEPEAAPAAAPPEPEAAAAAALPALDAAAAAADWLEPLKPARSGVDQRSCLTPQRRCPPNAQRGGLARNDGRTVAVIALSKSHKFSRRHDLKPGLLPSGCALRLCWHIPDTYQERCRFDL